MGVTGNLTPGDRSSLDGPQDTQEQLTDGGLNDVANGDVANDVANDGVAIDVPLDLAMDVAIESQSSKDAAESRDAIGEETSTGGGDAGDANGRQCFSWQPFGAPTPVAGLVDLDDDFLSVRLSPDELIAYMSSGPSGRLDKFDILISSRASRFEPFRPATPLSALNATSEDSWPTVTADGLTLYMNSTRGGEHQLFVSSRAFVAAEFSTPKELSTLDVSGEGGPYVTPDGSALYFHSWRALGSADLYRATRNGASFNAPDRLAVINTDANEFYPVVMPDELTIYYLTNADPLGQNGIWMATRASVSEPFGAAVFLRDLTGPLDALPNWISPDGCRLYYNQRDASLRHWAYVAERNP
jgi:hypothetical protein